MVNFYTKNRIIVVLISLLHLSMFFFIIIILFCYIFATQLVFIFIYHEMDNVNNIIKGRIIVDLMKNKVNNIIICLYYCRLFLFVSK